MWRVNGRAWNYFHAWGTTSQVRSDQQIKLFRLHLSVFQDIFFKKCLDSGSLSTAVRHLNLECLNWLPWWLSGKESACQWRRYGFDLSEVIDISPGSLDSSLCFFQPCISHDVLCICWVSRVTIYSLDVYTPFLIWNQSVVPCPVLTLTSWLAYRFLKR